MIKKRIIPLIILFSALWLTAAQAAAASRFSDGVYTFEKGAGNTAIITDCNLTDSEIEVPGYVLGYPVAGIADYAFLSKSSLRSIILPESVTSIGEYAFAENPELQAVAVPRSCSIADNAFLNSPNVTIRCWYGSEAENYAKSKHLKCEYIDSIPIGDANGDGLIRIEDATSIQYHLAELRVLDGIRLAAADANQDGVIDITDATALQMFIAEYDLSYPIGKPITPDNSL